MAVEWRHLIFGDADSADYGIYISGDGVYNAPERAVEFVDVPGRNGAIALDQGRYNNIEITYPAGTFAKTQEEFRENLSAFRNAILSQKGYQRLEDTYHPEEYRMGVYSSGLEVSPASYNQAGEFELIFNCKPQRWLTVGEYPIPIDSGDVLQNPTPFNSGPLLEITGHGNISFNGYEIALEDEVMGTVELDTGKTSGEPGTTTSVSVVLDDSLFNTGDTIEVTPTSYAIHCMTTASGTYSNISGTGSGDVTAQNIIGTFMLPMGLVPKGTVILPGVTFTAGTPADYDYTATFTATGSGVANFVFTVACNIAYTVVSGVHTITVTVTGAVSSNNGTVERAEVETWYINADSTVSVLGDPTYIDCELGEAYLIRNNTPVSLNSKVALGSDLPVLSPGSNKITFGSGVTGLRISPRWWKI